MTIAIYSKPGCFPCKKTVEKFRAAGLEPQVVDITEVPAALEYISTELGYTQAPVIVYDRDGSEDHWSGLNPDKINHVIDLEQSRRPTGQPGPADEPRPLKVPAL